MRLTRAASAAVVVALLTACGSTVQVKSSSLSAPGGQNLGGDGLSTSGGGVTPGAGSTNNAAAGSTSGTSGTSTPIIGAGGSSTGSSSSLPDSGSTGATAPGGAGPGVSGALSGRGFTKTTISLGVGTANDYNSFAGSFGLKGVGYEGNPAVWFQAAADDINKHGGLMGRKIVLVSHDFSTAQELSDTAAANQAACTTWTQDKPVFAVLFAGFLVEDTLLNCLAKASTPLVYPGAGLDYPLHYRQAYVRFPLFFNLAQMVGERFDSLAIGRLVARGFFDPWDTSAGKPGPAVTPTRIGLIGFDDPDGKIQQSSQQKELGRHGLKAYSTIPCPRSLTNKISCERSAVLRFAANGVTHVFGAYTTFMNNAQSQGYHPRYFIAVSAQAFAANEGANQLNGAMGEGYVPFSDVATSEYPGDPTPATGRCRALMKAVGQSSSDPTTLLLQMSVCDEFFFVQAAVDRAEILSAAGLRSGLEGLGSSQESALTWKSFLGPNEHASAPVLRDLIYKSDIARFVYVSKTNYGDL